MREVLHGLHAAHSIRLVWKTRNEVLHSQEDTDLVKIRSAETTEITHLHGQPDLLDAIFRPLSLLPVLGQAPFCYPRYSQTMAGTSETVS